MTIARTLLASLAVFALASPGAAQERLSADSLPRTGNAGPGLEAFDEAVCAMLVRHGIPGASLAIAVEGRLVHYRGYGTADEKGTPVRPETLIALSSLSKPLTAAATLKLVEQGKLHLDEPVFAYLSEIKPFSGGRVDLRLQRVTVRHCLNHTGGWDRTRRGEPLDGIVADVRKLDDVRTITPEHFLSRMWDVSLDFEPGRKSVYSNVGYVILGEVIEKASGQSYEKYVQEHVLKPAGATTARLHHGEVEYFENESHRFVDGGKPFPPLQRTFANAALGWTASSLDMVRFLCALDGSHGERLLRPETQRLMLTAPPPPYQSKSGEPHPGLGWPTTIVSEDGREFGYFQDGRNYGSRAFMKRSPRGVNWVLLFNGRLDPDAADKKLVGDAIAHVRARIEEQTEFPEIDYFKHLEKPVDRE